MAEKKKWPQKLAELLDKTFEKNQFWIEPGILPKGGTMLFGGAAAIGKSFVLLEISRALATGTRPFDSSLFSVPQKAKVLVIEQELGERELQERSSQTFARHKPLQYSENLYYLSKVPEMQLNEAEGAKYLHEAIGKVEPNIVMLDPISMFHHYDENSNSEIGELFRRLEKIKESYANLDLSFIITHHFRKPSTSTWNKPDPLSPYNFSGSQRWFNTPDTRVTFNRTKNLADGSGWFLESRWIPRMGKQLEDITFLITPNNEEAQVRIHSGGGDKDGVESKKPLPMVARKTTKKGEDID